MEAAKRVKPASRAIGPHRLCRNYTVEKGVPLEKGLPSLRRVGGLVDYRNPRAPSGACHARHRRHSPPRG